MARIFVTGATGFIGSHLVRHLVSQGHSVRCLVRSPNGHALPAEAEPVPGDLACVANLEKSLRGMEIVFHLAGLTKAFSFSDFVRANAEGTHNLAAACARQTTPPVLAMASSLAAMGPARDGKPLFERDRCAPVSHYGRSKRLAERALARLAAAIPISIVRPGLVFGPGDRGMLPMFQSIHRFGLHAVPGTRAPKIALLYVGDFVDQLVQVAERGSRLTPGSAPQACASGVYMLAASPQPTMLEFGRWLAQAVQRRHFFSVHVPGLLPWIVAGASELFGRISGTPPPLNLDKIREAIAGDWTANTSTVQRELGILPERPLREQLRATAEWYRQAGWL